MSGFLDSLLQQPWNATADATPERINDGQCEYVSGVTLNAVSDSLCQLADRSSRKTCVPLRMPKVDASSALAAGPLARSTSRVVHQT